MSTTINLQIAKRWMQAFNEHNLDMLLSLYHEQAVHFSPKLLIRLPETKGLIKGKVAMHSWWKDAFDRLPTLSYLPTNFIANDSMVFMEYLRKVQGEEELKVGEVLEIKDGLIVASRVYHG
ncbi:MAG TPA: nuclear transport factor 2 family protein [Bacteroidia bacterium]|nr:nuclear transport factor 2 family protein [Bacteroidia bacterium]